MGQPPVSSPFSQTDLQPIADSYSKRSAHMGIRLPDGRVLINFNDGSSFAIIKAIAKTLRADIVTVKGTWTFVPDRIEDE